jgi:hypothetical protein
LEAYLLKFKDFLERVSTSPTTSPRWGGKKGEGKSKIFLVNICPKELFSNFNAK